MRENPHNKIANQNACNVVMIYKNVISKRDLRDKNEMDLYLLNY